MFRPRAIPRWSEPYMNLDTEVEGTFVITSNPRAFDF